MAEEQEVTNKRIYELEECSKHKSEKDCWIVVHGKVYDVTEFLDEHPGGYDIVVAASGRDSTEDFEEIGHSSTAQEMLQTYYIGDFAGGDVSTKKKVTTTAVQYKSKSSPASAMVKALLPLLFIALAVLVALYFQKA